MEAHAHLRLLAVAVALAAALVALGAWVAVDRTHGGGGGATGEATALVDELDAAANAADGARLKELLAPGVVMRALGETWTGEQAVARQLTGGAKAGLRWHRIAPVSVEGAYATTFNAYAAGRESGVMLAAFRIHDGRIDRIWGMQPPVMPPFGNEVMP